MNRLKAPEIVSRAAFRLVGLIYTGKNEHAEVQDLWDEFIRRAWEVTADPQKFVAYGVARALPGVPESEGFEYLAGVEVTSKTRIPADMIVWEIPALTYAVLSAHDVAEIVSVSDYFYRKWLQGSTEWQASERMMVEVYPKDYGQSTLVYLYFPVRPK
jgi:predicted transcriptional regulator YdeE